MKRSSSKVVMQPAVKETIKLLQVSEFTKRRSDEDKTLLGLGQMCSGIVVSDSKLKVIVTLIRKVGKLSEECMASEVTFAIVNKLHSSVQCQQIMQDHKNIDNFIGGANTIVINELRRQIMSYRDKYTLLFEDL